MFLTFLIIDGHGAGAFTLNVIDPDRGFVILSTPTMADVQRFLDWTKDQPGIGSARVDIPIKYISELAEKIGVLIRIRQLSVVKN